MEGNDQNTIVPCFVFTAGEDNVLDMVAKQLMGQSKPLRSSPRWADANLLDRNRSKSRTQECLGDASLERNEHRSPRPWETEHILVGNRIQSER